MRLRLRIERNALPPVSLLWPLTPTQSTSLTIAHLLSSIDGTIPLETQTWGLEDYIVTLAGYECLQHHTVSSVFAQDDEVVIRPRTWAETRARTVLGRSAVTDDGRRVEDGVPWGRVGLRGTIRPEVEIPAKRKRGAEEEQDNKRVRFAEGEDEGGLEGGEEQVMIEGVPAGRRRTVLPFDVGNEDEDDEEDDDFEMGEEEEKEVASGSSLSSSSESESESSSDSSSSGSDVSSDSDSSSGSSDSSNDSSSDSSSDGEETPDSSETPWSGILSSPAKAKHPPMTNGAPAKTKQARTGATQQPQTNGVRKQAPPGSGSSTTKGRNVRRRDAKKLKHLQSTGTLPPDATLTTMYEWRDSGKLPETDKSASREVTQERSEEESAAAAEERASAEVAEQVSSLSKAMQEKRKQLLADLESGGVEVTQKKRAAEPEIEEVDERPEEMSSKADAMDTSADSVANGVAHGESPQTHGAATAEQPAESSSRRARLDANSAQRLLFGSLGVRVPRTAEQKIALQKKLAGEARKAVPRPAPAAEDAPRDAPEEEEDPDAWRSKINLRAVECWDEDVELSTPPYPFYQRWDAQYRKKKNRNQHAYTASGGGRKRRRGQQQVQQGQYDDQGETYDKYHITDEGDFLDYGDDLDYGAWDEDAEYWEEGALLRHEEGEEEWDEDPSAAQLQDEAAADAVVDTFPPLPQALGTLSTVTKEEVKQGDYVVYEELACSPATGWQPKMLVKTVQLLEKEGVHGEAGNEWRVKVAPRDLRPKRFDEEGNRVYEKFEMAGASDDEGGDEEGVEVLQLGDIAVLMLLQRAADAGVAGDDK